MSDTQNKFSTFAGVFTPSILTILGVILFMRAGFVVGHAGIIQAFIILLFAKVITTLTTFSVSAIATNMKVEGGGAYYLISRTLGPAFGGTIGLALFLAQTLSIPLYILGFTEALTTKFEPLEAYKLIILIGMTVAVFIIAFRGAQGAIKIQFYILAVLLFSIGIFLVGLALNFSQAQFIENLGPNPEAGALSFWQLFAIYFPAVTGIMAGINMSGDLKDPSRSISRGTFLAIGAGALIYGAQIILMGGGVERTVLINNPYGVLLEQALFGAGFVVALGVYAATLSSALGSFVGAPRILSALALDNILKPFQFFRKVGSDGEPRRAVVLSFVISLAVVIWASSSGEGALNIVAGIVSMFFLWAYGIINMAAFVESFGSNPSFRPRFKLFHWSIALLGAVGCIGVAILINPVIAIVALLTIIGIFYYVRVTVLESSFGDARRGFYYSRLRSNLINLEDMPEHAKNWRPTILLFSDSIDPKMRLMARYAEWFDGGRGIVLFGQVLQGGYDSAASQHYRATERIKDFADEMDISLFPTVAVSSDWDSGFMVLLQTAGIGPVRPNLLYMHLSEAEGEDAQASFIRRMNHANQLNMSVMLNVIPEEWTPPTRRDEKRIDVWWRGKENGSLMAILAWLLTVDPDWSGSTIRLLRLVENDEEKKQAHEEMHALITEARLEATIYPLIDHVSDFPAILLRESKSATCVFMGMELPVRDDETFFARTNELVEGLPPIFFVSSAGEVDLLA